MRKENLLLAGEHASPWTSDVLPNCTLETYAMLLTNVAPIRSTNKIHKQKKISLDFKVKSFKRQYKLNFFRQISFQAIRQI